HERHVHLPHRRPVWRQEPKIDVPEVSAALFGPKGMDHPVHPFFYCHRVFLLPVKREFPKMGASNRREDHEEN
ncbi:MAG TPA: hypothetical protein PLO28_07535, partial [bacterium]|nr:hypothetical protein [bacterium]